MTVEDEVPAIGDDKRVVALSALIALNGLGSPAKGLANPLLRLPPSELDNLNRERERAKRDLKLGLLTDLDHAIRGVRHVLLP